MTEQVDPILAALEALTAEVRGLRADLAPKPTFTWSATIGGGNPIAGGTTCPKCGWYVLGDLAAHFCPASAVNAPVAPRHLRAVAGPEAPMAD